MPHIVANGAKLSYQQVGDGPDVILIHGLATNRAFWFLQPLQMLKEEYRVTMFDLRGHGYSSMPEQGYTSADMADDLAALMDHLRIENAVLVGHSYGGVVGLQYATRNQERVKGLVLADSRVISLQPIQRIEEQAELQGMEKELIAGSIDDWREEPHVGMRLLEDMARHKLKNGSQRSGQDTRPGFNPFGGMGKGERSAKQWLQLLETTTAHGDIRSSAGLTLDRISAFRKPIVSIYGERSRCIETCRQLQMELPHSDTIIVPGVGHFHPIVRPRYFTNAVLDFIEMTNAIPNVADIRRKDSVHFVDRRNASGLPNRNGQQCRRRGERRVAWRKRGWNGPERRNGARDSAASWLQKQANVRVRNSLAVTEIIQEKQA